MIKKILAIQLLLFTAVPAFAEWEETVTNPATDDTVMINDTSQPEGSKTQYTSFGNFPVSTQTQTVLDTKGQVNSVVAGSNVTVDNTDPANPVVNSTSTGGGIPEAPSDTDAYGRDNGTWTPVVKTADVVTADVDDVTLSKTGTTSIILSVKDGGVSPTKLADVVTAGSVTNANITINSKGQVTAATSGAGSGGISIVDTPPVDPSSGDAWLLTTDDKLYIKGPTSTWNTIALTEVDDPTSGNIPDYQWDLEDNAASQTVVETYGVAASVFSNTSGLTYSADCYDGNCFDFAAASASSTDRVNLSTMPSAMYTDDTFTIQVSFWLPETPSITTSIKLFEGTNNMVFGAFNNSDTELRLLYRGSVVGNATIDDVTTGSWQVIRVVFDSGSANVYQGASEETLVLKDTITNTFGTASSAGYLSMFGNSTEGQGFVEMDGKGDQIKIWDGAEYP